ncbi:hypothetical protein BHE74_00057586 [Ensete ventricosum]|nr:hypothetical protein BHE74_00057586 [Ensete ventricosum]
MRDREGGWGSYEVFDVMHREDASEGEGVEVGSEDLDAGRVGGVGVEEGGEEGLGSGGSGCRIPLRRRFPEDIAEVFETLLCCHQIAKAEDGRGRRAEQNGKRTDQELTPLGATFRRYHAKKKDK